LHRKCKREIFKIPRKEKLAKMDDHHKELIIKFSIDFYKKYLSHFWDKIIVNLVDHIIDLKELGIFEQLKYDFVNKFNDRIGCKLFTPSDLDLKIPKNILKIIYFLE
jgi:hypothetical protein